MGALEEELVEHVAEIAATVARQVHPKYAVYFDAADVRQELVIWALKRPRKIREWLDPAQESKDLKIGIKFCAKAMRREAEKYCRTQKAKICGYDLRGEYFYTAGMIEELIASLHSGVWGAQNTQARVSGGAGDPATGGNYLVHIIDTKRAMEMLDPSDQLLLEMRYQEGQTLGQIAAALGLSDSTVHRRVKAALRRMVEFLGGENPWQRPSSKPVSLDEAE